MKSVVTVDHRPNSPVNALSIISLRRVATAKSQLFGEALVTTTVTNSTLEVQNPAGNSTPLTITPLAGGTRAASALLVNKCLQ